MEPELSGPSSLSRLADQVGTDFDVSLREREAFSFSRLSARRASFPREVDRKQKTFAAMSDRRLDGEQLEELSDLGRDGFGEIGHDQLEELTHLDLEAGRQ